jgi:PAS domain S-box-containing protein
MTESERHRYLDLFEHAPTGYIMTDPAGVIEATNHSAAALLGYERQELTGKPLALVFRERDNRHLDDQMARAASEKKGRTWHAWVQPRKGEAPVAVSVALVPIADPKTSTPKGFRLILQDLTEMIKSKDRIRDLEDGLLRRVSERTARLTEENEQLKLIVAGYVKRYGALPVDGIKAPAT